MPATPVADLSFDTTVFPDPFSFDHETDNAPAPIPLDPPKPKKPRVNHTNVQRALVVGLKALTDFTNREIEAALGIETRTIQKIYKKARDRGFDPDQRPLDLDEKYIGDGERTGRPRKNPVEPVVLDVPGPDDEDAPAEADFQGAEVDEGKAEDKNTEQYAEQIKERVVTNILPPTTTESTVLPTENSVPIENNTTTEPVAAPKKRKRKEPSTPATRLRAGKKGTQVPGKATETGSAKETPKRTRLSKKDTTKTTTTTTVKRARTTKAKGTVVSEPVPQVVQEGAAVEGEVLSDTGADEDAAILQQLQAQLQAENGSRMNGTATTSTNATSRGRGARTRSSGGGTDADGDVGMAGVPEVEPFNINLSE